MLSSGGWEVGSEGGLWRCWNERGATSVPRQKARVSLLQHGCARGCQSWWRTAEAAEFLKAAPKVKIFSLLSCQELLILHGLRLKALRRCITCLRPPRAIEAQRSADFVHLLLVFFFPPRLLLLWLSVSAEVGRGRGVASTISSYGILFLPSSSPSSYWVLKLWIQRRTKIESCSAVCTEVLAAGRLQSFIGGSSQCPKVDKIS